MDFFIVFLKAIGSVFLNPIFYWMIVLSFLPSDNRIKLEETFFNHKVLPIGTELKNTLKLSLFITSLMLIFTIGFKVTFPYEIIVVLSVVIVLLSFKMRYTFLSASYTLGFTYLIIWFLPKGPLENVLYTDWTFISIAIIIGLFLIGEAILFIAFNPSEASPKLAYSKRGRWYGVLQVKQLSIIPFLVFLPQEVGTINNTIMPTLFIGEDAYTFFIMPFALGFSHLFKGDLPAKYSKNIGFSLLLLALTVLCLAFGSLKINNLSFLAVILAIVGRALIHYIFYKIDLKKPPFFIEGHPYLRVLGVVSGSPAEKLGFKIGDTILKINDQRIHSLEQLDHLLRETAENCLMEINRTRGRLRFIEINEYKGNSLELGLIFAREPVQPLKGRR